MSDKYILEDLTSTIIKSFFVVYNQLGYGFLEKVYENALKIELEKHLLRVDTQRPIYVYYDHVQVGEYFADLVVNEKVIIELKASESICKAHEIQLINYLKATQIEVGLLLNFGKTPELKRKIFSNTGEKKSDNTDH